MSRSTLAMSGRHHAELRSHLFPGDGLEAAAVLLCAVGMTKEDLLVRHTILIPHAECSRTADRIVWPGDRLAQAQAVAEEKGLGIVLLHSHPGGTTAFSMVDDESDGHVIPQITNGWCGGECPAAGTAIMVPSGWMRARIYDRSGKIHDVDQVRIAGDDILHFLPDRGPELGNCMAFGAEMTKQLGERRACVIGVSGTGSVVAEQLARLGFGAITLIDFDRIERRNLNRILNSVAEDAETGRAKVDVFRDAILRHRPDATVTIVDGSIMSREGVSAAAACDVVFSCVDSAEGRQIADLTCQAFVIPLIDMGVSIPTRRLPSGEPAIADVLGRIDYVQPGASTLRSREVFTPSSLRSEYLRGTAPDVYASELREGYIRGTTEEAPAVISLNMRAASAAVLEYVARAFPFRHRPNADFARTLFRLGEGEEEIVPEKEFGADDFAPYAMGGAEPLLGMPALAPCG